MLPKVTPLFFLIFLVAFCNVVRSQSVFNVILNGLVSCPCNRNIYKLDVSKTSLYTTDFENDNEKQYYVGDGSTFVNTLDSDRCLHVFFQGFNADYNIFASYLKYLNKNITCNNKKIYYVVIDHFIYTNPLPEPVGAYKKSVYYTKSISYQVTQNLIVPAMKKLGKNNVYIVGHSLGAHMAGYAGEYVNNALGYKPKEIISIDPAGPCFKDCPNDHVKAGQADLVRSYHCDGGSFGSLLDVADYDFYSYDGMNQPSCGQSVPDAVFALLGNTCDHEICVPTVYDTVNVDGIWNATACSTYSDYTSGTCDGNVTTLAGYDKVPTTTEGKYYFKPDVSVLNVLFQELQAILS